MPKHRVFGQAVVCRSAVLGGFLIAGSAAGLFAQGLTSDDVAVVQLAEVWLEGSDDSGFDTLGAGARKFEADMIEDLSDSAYDPNELLEILPNVQFDQRRFRLGPDELGDLSPTEISIAGARAGENNFVIDGIGTNNLLDSISAQAFDQVEASNQAVFIDSDLLKNFTVYDSNVPAEYGDFLGGSVVAETRDPDFEFRGKVSFDYASSDLVEYLIDESRIERPDPSEPFPEPTEFTRIRYGANVDVPITDRIRTLFSYSRAEAEVIRGALSSAYFTERRARTTIRENLMGKVHFDIGETSLLSLQTILTPYEDQYWKTNINRQFGGGSSSKIAWATDFDNSSIEASLGYTTAENSREEESDWYLYLNTASVDWVPDDRNTAQRGGFGDFDQFQDTLELDLVYRFRPEQGNLSAGIEARRIRGERGRPETVYGYRDGVETFPNAPIIAPGPPDGSIIEGEQYLQERNDYRAFSAKAEIHDLALFLDANREYELLSWLDLTPSVGVRGTYDDFLGNVNFAPRLNLTFGLPLEVKFNAGYNRYYAKNQLLYALREQDPDNFVYSRDVTLDPFQGYVLGPWELERQSRASSYSAADLKTPYSDELVASVSAPIWELGQFRVKALVRKSFDGFARSEPIEDIRIDEFGNPFTFRRFELTNNGEGEYRSLSLEWNKNFRNHNFSASTTISENQISAGTDTLLSNTDPEIESELVFFEGEVLPYRNLEIERENFNTPAYVSFSWTSHWFDRSLQTGIRGRYTPSFERIVDTGDTTQVGSETFDVYEQETAEEQFVLDANIHYTLDLRGDLELKLRVSIDNLLNTVPNVAVTRFNPYQQGRSFSFGASLEF
jgi:hypothetical protein